MTPQHIAQLWCVHFLLVCAGLNVNAKRHRFGSRSSNVKCYRHASDVVFAIDSSFSIRKDDFDIQLTFLKHLIDTVSIGRNHIQVGVVSFGSKVRLDIRLDQFVSKSKLKKAVGRIKYMNSGTFTHEAIRFIRSQMFCSWNGGRPWAKKKLVLITDGLSSNTQDTLKEAALARKEGIEIFSVGVGERMEDFEAELTHVASEPKSQHLFQVRNYKALDTINNLLSDAACERLTDEDKAKTGSKADILEECKKNIAEVVFVLDSSNSIWAPDFEKQVTFVRNVTSTFDIGPKATRVGLVIYGEGASILQQLDDTQTKDHLRQVLASVVHINGMITNTATAIRRVRTQVLSKARPNVSRIVVVLTDGKSRNRTETAKEARLAHQQGVHVFAIGIGRETDANDLMSIASDPDDKYVFHVDSADRLPHIKDLLLMKSCDVVIDVMQKDGNADKSPMCQNDVVFVYDADWLSRRQNNFIVRTISDVIESETLNTQELRFGVIREAYHHVPLQDIKLTDNWNQPTFKTKLDADSKKSLIFKLLYRARTQYFREKSKKRQTLVLFLDSDMTDWFQAYRQKILLNKAKVKIIVVGFGKYFNKLQALTLTSYHDLIITQLEEEEKHSSSVVKGIIKRLCR